MKKNLLSFMCFFMLAWKVAGLSEIEENSLMGPVINDISILTPTVERFGKFEANIELTATFSNPYDFDQISVAATFVSPTKTEITVDGFFMKNYVLNEETGFITQNGQGSFRVRFSPTEPGNWQFSISVTDQTGNTTSSILSFTCTEIVAEANHGFLRKSNTNYLQFDDGGQYIAIGENMAWQNNNAYLDYKNWLEKLVDNGGNFIRLWHAHWGLGIEWSLWNGFEGLMDYKQSNCFYQDWLLDYCAENGVYVMLTLQHHGPVSTQVNPNWSDSPYNIENGGQCLNTQDFFIDESARTITKNRYRYIVARWGYSRNILCWELFNEVHWTDNFETYKADIANWHFEMADYLKSIDPNDHLVSTSYGDDLADEEVWSYPSIDFTQSHTYANVSNIERTLAVKNKHYLEAFGKPTLNGEFGLGISSSLSNQDPEGIHIHNAIWGGLFGGGLGTAMTWWWDNYIHPQDLYHHFSGIAGIAETIPFLEQNLQPVTAFALGAPDDLTLTPSLGWGGIGVPDLSINTNGSLSPEGAELGQFLYGSEWNTQFRSPPTFAVNFPQAGNFSVLTGGDTGTNPILNIKLDGITQLEQPAGINAVYTIMVPAGEHLITVDNVGTDWIAISGYLFEGLGSQIDAHVLVSDNKEYITGWLLNNRYNHNFVNDYGEPLPTPPASVVVEGVMNGTYNLRWLDPNTGIELESDVAIASNGTLYVPTMPIYWDALFIADSPVVKTDEASKDVAIEIYPNPIKAGESITIKTPTGLPPDSTISLFDINGKMLQTWIGSGNKIALSSTLTTGPYYVKYKISEGESIHPIIIAE